MQLTLFSSRRERGPPFIREWFSSDSRSELEGVCLFLPKASSRARSVRWSLALRSLIDGELSRSMDSPAEWWCLSEISSSLTLSAQTIDIIYAQTEAQTLACT